VIGNDIVDLEFVDSPAYLHVRHLERVCTPEELNAIRESAIPSRSLAVVWASKEAAYKLLVQEGIDCKFVPRQFVTDFKDRSETCSGFKFAVHYCGIRRIVTIATTKSWVHAVAISPEDSIVRWVVGKMESCHPRWGQSLNESNVVRRLATGLLSDSGQENVVLEFRERVPVLRCKAGGPAGIGMSLSHHGAFAAAAIAWAPGPESRKQPVVHCFTETSALEGMCSTYIA
jgi:phosphopantetheinyl transferase (holo-ACP synthase)